MKPMNNVHEDKMMNAKMAMDLWSLPRTWLNRAQQRNLEWIRKLLGK